MGEGSERMRVEGSDRILDRPGSLDSPALRDRQRLPVYLQPSYTSSLRPHALLAQGRIH
jgi:hypothetical protein